MVYIEEDREMGRDIKDFIDTLYIFRKDNDTDFWDLAPEGTGLEGWREDEYYFDLVDEGKTNEEKMRDVDVLELGLTLE